MKEYDVEWLEVKTLKKGNLELGHIKKGRYLSPPDLAGVEFSQYIPKDNIYGIYAESAKQAECYFSQFCQQKRIKCMRVPKGTEKTPDFVFYPSGQKVAVEVKWRGDDGGITKENGLIDRAPYGIGRWVYDQIRESSKQFKTFWEQGIPTMLLLVDGSSESRLEEYEIERGMYGHEVVKLKVHSDWTECVGIRNEYEYRMANGNRQRVSAVAHLQSYGKVSGNDPNIVYHPEVYHRLYVCYNPFADYPLSQEWLKDIDFSMVDLIEGQNER
ncbi:MAG: hypothetical protein OXH63_17785 [Gemmatimonadetes bacterium]|nr:hypothetical protein [Gemmatimonadota bacterium]